MFLGAQKLAKNSLIAVLAVAGLAGCNVLSSDHATRLSGYDTGLSVGPFTCNSTAGYYNLPKTMLAASISYDRSGSNVTGPKFQGIALKPVADPDHRYCLTFNSSASTGELLKVQKNSNDLLSLVSSNALEQSRFIFQSLLQTIFVGITGSVTGSVRSNAFVEADGREIKYINTFDPFDYADTARFNDRAKDFGYCVFIPGYAFDPGKMTIQQYCNDPNWALKKHVPIWKRQSVSGQLSMVNPGRTAPVVARVVEEDLLDGVLYRPKFPYQVYLMEKQGSKWKIRERRTVMLENISPILSVHVRRSGMAQRTSAFIFRDGVLENVCIYNTSGAAEFVEIPLSLARAIVRLPAEIISVRIGESRADRAIAEVETKVLLAQQRQLELLANPSSSVTATTGNVSVDGYASVNQNALNTSEASLLADPRAAALKILNDNGDPTAKCPALNPAPELGAASVLSAVSGFKKTDDTRRPHLPN